jgi:poly(A) polymerase
MIKNSSTSCSARSAAAPRGPAHRRARRGAAAEHGIDPRWSTSARVQGRADAAEAGLEAYIVGGAVRDLLLGLRPKDFDVATDATPEQVKALFRRAFIIGRRFPHRARGVRPRPRPRGDRGLDLPRLHGRAGRRAGGRQREDLAQRAAGKSHVVDASGRVLRDNVWGPQIEDAARRDFTVNALYYDPRTQIVVDYHGGIATRRSACCA